MLTDTQIRNAKPEAKLYKLRDGAGLYLEVTPAGGKYWRYRFELQGKEGIYSIGEYPHIKAPEARMKRDAAKLLVKEGTNPVQDKKLKRMELQYADAQTFAHVADEWFSSKSGHWSDGYKATVKRIIDRDLIPHLGALPVAKIKTPMVHSAIKKVEKRGAATQAILARQVVGSILKLAILTSRADYDVAEPLKGQIVRKRVQHRKHLERIEIGGFLRKLEDYTGHRQTVIALRLLMMTAVRPGELTGALWKEFDLDNAEWRIPASRMKMRKQHIVPLSKQAVALLRELHELTGHGGYLFPVQGTKRGTMPGATLRNAINKMGYGTIVHPHGFRGTFSTVLNELGYKPDVIERQLAHGERNAVRASYHHAEYLLERKAMMQDYSDLLERSQLGGTVIQFKGMAA